MKEATAQLVWMVGAMSHCLKYRGAKSQATFSGKLAAHCFPFGHGMQAVISDLKC
jgi:hypothetical protein